MPLRIILLSLLSFFIFSACQKPPALKLDDKAAPLGSPAKPTIPVSTSTNVNTSCLRTETRVHLDKTSNQSTTQKTEIQTDMQVVKKNIQVISDTKKSYDKTLDYKRAESDVSSVGAKSNSYVTDYTSSAKVESESSKIDPNTFQVISHEIGVSTGRNGYKFKENGVDSETREFDKNIKIVFFDDGQKSHTISFSSVDSKHPKNTVLLYDEETTYTVSANQTKEHTLLKTPFVENENSQSKDTLTEAVEDCTITTSDGTPSAQPIVLSENQL